MGLHDRINGGNGNGSNGDNGPEPLTALAAAAPKRAENGGPPVDPYAELKTRVHHACIAKLGPQLFSTDSAADLSDQVLRTVTEQVALDRTPAHARRAAQDRPRRSRTTSSATARSSRSSATTP